MIAKEERPTDEEIRRFDKQRKNKKVSNEEWVSKTDPDSRITQMKDGRTHLAYKAEHVVDLESDLVVAAEVYTANQGDPETLSDSLLEAQLNLEQAGSETRVEEAVADKGYHAAETLEMCTWLGVRTYIPEPKHRYPRRWTDKPPEFKQASYNTDGE